tara:strand:- start:349 stop:543 length:195 start_codon:yes stop_codon:yes gene_type:complete
MSKFGDLIRGIKAAPAPEPVVEAPVLEDMNKKELEAYGRTMGIELDRRHKKEDLIEELKEAEGE